MADYLKTGVNRLSIGLQSADDGELRILGRIHTWKEFLKTYEEARKAGCDNINIDLMSAIPGQTLNSYERTLEKICRLLPDHVSAYSLILERGRRLETGMKSLLIRRGIPRCRMRRRSVRCTSGRKRSCTDMAMNDMKFPTMQKKGKCAAIISATGSGFRIWDLVWERLHSGRKSDGATFETGGSMWRFGKNISRGKRPG